jgi:hypothetical protein
MSTNKLSLSHAVSEVNIVDIAMTDMYDFMMRAQLAHPAIAYRFLRGHQCRTERDLFNELAAGLQFPCYFGGNWGAFEECLRDLTDIHQRPFVAVIGNAHYLLQNEETNSLKIFLDTLNRVINNIQSRKNGMFVNFLLQAEGSTFHSLRDRMTALDIQFSVGEFDFAQ